ncbi:MAG: hydroxymethylbilane synthase [Candidatus Eremiobacteraeota bacterium]|nr:hydroxymethylbilane synthase [Candidatus Eremiobacteraeota bacterium]MBV8366416.1 hydroxymethylbilane synthase [Candidatus Eremiobacteraeota bacterium]
MQTVTTVRVATRPSALALAQAQIVMDMLTTLHGEINFEIVKVSTRGDQEEDRSLTSIGGDGVFVKELESALLGNRADVAVHSMKDMPMELPAGVRAGVVPMRADARDVLLSRANAHRSIFKLPNNAVVGTSSLRRAAQIHAIKPLVHVKECRGNIDTRIKKMLDGQFDALVVALAGVQRLGLPPEVGEASPIPMEEMVPAVGQGALFVQYREADLRMQQLVAPLNEPQSAMGVAIERAFLTRLGGGCVVPVGANASVFGDRWLFHAFVGSVDGKHAMRRDAEGITHDEADATAAVEDIAEEMLESGARWVLAAHKGG